MTNTDTQCLIDVFATGPCSAWDRENIAGSKLVRFAQAYLMMARAGYRPGAPSDGHGNIQLLKGQLSDQDRLYQDAVRYACEFNHEEDGDHFYVGCSNFTTNRAFVLSIEAARLLASGSSGSGLALRLLRLAAKETEATLTAPATA